MTQSASFESILDMMSVPDTHVMVLEALLETGLESETLEQETMNIFQSVIQQIKEKK